MPESICFVSFFSFPHLQLSSDCITQAPFPNLPSAPSFALLVTQQAVFLLVPAIFPMTLTCCCSSDIKSGNFPLWWICRQLRSGAVTPLCNTPSPRLIIRKSGLFIQGRAEFGLPVSCYSTRIHHQMTQTTIWLMTLIKNTRALEKFSEKLYIVWFSKYGKATLHVKLPSHMLVC